MYEINPELVKNIVMYRWATVEK